jgi:hypothetical protein
MMKYLIFLLIILNATLATARNTEPSMPMRPGVWVHSELDAQGRVDSKNTISICETAYTDLWQYNKHDEQGEGCSKSQLAMPGDQITDDQDCEDDMGNPHTSITHIHSLYVPIRAGAGPITAYKLIITSTTKNHLGKVTAQNREISLHQWSRPCARKDDGKIYDTKP